MESVVLLNKPVSYTPLQAIEEFKDQNPEYKGEKMSYAGRLDPMAEGLLVCLVGEENKNRGEYENLDKEYEFEALFGLSTDTYDVMGLVQNSDFPNYPDNLESRIENHLEKFRGEFNQKYPPYSSYRINGKPLFWWAREDKLDEIEIPQKKINVKSLQILSSYQLESGQLLESIRTRVSSTEGDFRQEKIITAWEELLREGPDFKFSVFKFNSIVSSGTYIRSIAHNLGKKVELGAIAVRIIRTRIGEYKLENAINL